MKNKLMTVKDVMKIFSVSRRTIYYWIEDGILHPIKIGGVFRFHPEDIDQLIEKSRPADSRRKRRILAIDDDVLIRESLKTIMERAGFEITVVSSGEEAVDKVATESFDLVLTDVRMPGMNGIETLKQIRHVREQLNMTHLPEIVFTAYEDINAQREAQEMGVKDFVYKPFDLDVFLKKIKSAIA